jgi:hypothetical protein
MRIVLIAALAVAITTSMRADLALSHGLCVVPETNYFSCQTKNNRWVGLCGALPGKLQYRFGTQGRMELRFPANAADGVNTLRYAHYLRFQTDRIEVTFRNQGISYAVFDYTEDRVRRAGVRVTTVDGKEHEIICTSGMVSRLAELEKVLQCDTENALNGGNCP